MVHEAPREDFLVLFGEAILIVEGQERPVKPWDCQGRSTFRSAMWSRQEHSGS
jgi:hypothetical protein